MARETILYERDGDVAVVRFNEPATRNAVSADTADALLVALHRAADEARAIVLGGTGGTFCSGAKLTGGGLDPDDPRVDIGRLLERTLNPVVALMRATEVPIVTAVRGGAAGIGCAFALAGDLIVAGESAYFLQAFRQVGLVPDGGSSYLLAHAAGRPRAMEMMLLGTRIPAAQALDWGLINRLVPDAEVDDAALALARELAAGPKAIGLIKRLAWSALDTAFETALADERTAQRTAGRTADFREGVSAFREKRKPRFSGR